MKITQIALFVFGLFSWFAFMFWYCLSRSVSIHPFDLLTGIVILSIASLTWTSLLVVSLLASRKRKPPPDNSNGD